MAPKRILVLHGYAQNGIMFSKRLGALRKQCGKDIEMVFADGPLILKPVDMLFGSAAIGAVDAASEPDVNDPSTIARGWWKYNEDRTQAIGLEDTLATLRDMLRDNDFHGVLGFSQGACLAALLSALLEHPDVYPPFLVDGKPPHPPFQFCVVVAGFRLRDPLADKIFRKAYYTLTLHVIGETDIIVTEERTQGLLQISANKRVEKHEGGHYVPSKTAWRRFLHAYLKDPLSDVPSPSGFGTPTVSLPSSGTATPVN